MKNQLNYQDLKQLKPGTKLLATVTGTVEGDDEFKVGEELLFVYVESEESTVEKQSYDFVVLAYCNDMEVMQETVDLIDNECSHHIDEEDLINVNSYTEFDAVSEIPGLRYSFSVI